MAVPGVFASDRNIAGTRRGDFASAILQLYPTGSAPLFALTSGMPSRSASDPVVTWFEEVKIPGRFTLTNAPGASGTTFSVDDGSSIIVNTQLLVADGPGAGEYVMVTAVNGNDLTVSRSYGGSTAGAITTGNALQRIGTMHEEGSDRPVAVANLGYPEFNLVQIFRNVWDVTGTAAATVYHTGSIVQKNRSDASFFHAEDMEKSSIWGLRNIAILKNQPLRSMNGLNNQIKTNKENAGATTSWDQLQAFLQKVFERNVRGKPNERIAFCGNEALRVINKIAINTSQLNITTSQTEFGIKVTQLITPFGDISLMTHPLMVESPLWTKDLYVYHPGAIETRYLRRTHHDAYNRDGTRAGRDADYGVFTTEMTTCYKHEKTGGLLLGLTNAAAPA